MCISNYSLYFYSQLQINIITLIISSCTSVRRPKSASVLNELPSHILSGKRVSSILTTSPSLISPNLRKTYKTKKINKQPLLACQVYIYRLLHNHKLKTGGLGAQLPRQARCLLATCKLIEKVLIIKLLFYGIDSLNGNVQLSIRLKIFEALGRFGARIGHSSFRSC